MNSNHTHLAVAMLFLLSLAVIGTGSAQAAAWEHELSIYGWLAGVDATTRIPIEGESDVEVDTSDVLEKINMVFMGNYAGKYDRWSIIADAVFLDVGDSGSTNVGGVTAAAAFDLKTWLLTGAVGYDLVQDSWGTLSVVGGARYLNLEVDADLVLNDTRSGGINESTGLWDGLIGLRGVFMLNDNWFLPYSADIGAGGSDLSYQLFAAIGYQFGWGDVRLGYRYLYYDLGDDKGIKDLSVGGPVLGVGFRF
jgi:hypothetical protein